MSESKFDSPWGTVTARAAIGLLGLAGVGCSQVRADWTRPIVASWKAASPAVQEWSCDLPRWAPGQQVRLGLEARIHFKHLGGSNRWMRVAVNGHYLTGPDLLNKPPDFTYDRNRDLSWSRGDHWRVVYSYSFEPNTASKERLYGSTDPFLLVWDVTRYVTPGTNIVRLELRQLVEKPTTIVLRNVKVEGGRPLAPAAREVVLPAPTGPLPTIIAKLPPKTPLRVRPAATGGFEIDVGGTTLRIITRASLPNGRWHETKFRPGGKPIAETESATASWRVGNCRIDRRISVFADHVRVVDTVTNLGDELVGVMIQHRLTGSGPPARVLLAGRTARDGTLGVRNSAHPSAFAEWDELGVGIVAEDDIFRVHVRSFREPGGIGLADDQLGLAPAASHTLEWSIYPRPGGDYWDFVNAVRRNWDVNITIPGPLLFAMYFRNRNSGPWYADWVRRRGARILVTGAGRHADGKPAHGTGLRSAKPWIAAQAGWIRKLRAEMPGVAVLPYFHAQISTEPNAERRYADARLLNAQSAHLRYPYRYPLPLFVPTRGNGYGRALRETIAALLKTTQASGLYWDEMAYSVQPFTYQAPWDGCTVVIDPRTHRVTGKRSSVALLMQPFKLELVEHLRKSGKILIANSQAVTRTMQRQNIVRFVETASYSNVIDTHLGCPLGLGNHHPENSAADAARTVRRILEFGGAYWNHTFQREPADWNFTDVMFPITPVELHPHVLLGEERILTARSGRFGWPDGAEADVIVVDGNGERVKRPNVRAQRDDGRWLHEIRMPSDHFAVLVKRPAS